MGLLFAVTGNQSLIASHTPHEKNLVKIQLS